MASMLVFGAVLAQTETTAVSVDIPPELVPLAQDLGCQTSTECAEKFDANIEQGIALAQKYDIYTPEQKKLASTFKTEVLERLSAVSQDNFEEEILALADKILKEKPALAKTMGVTRQAVSAAETIVDTVKNAGVDIRTCQKSPEDLSREQLIACVKAGNDLSNKGKSVEDYIPKGNVKAEEVGRMLKLEDSLLAGEYSGLGKISAEQAGQICLKPGSESISDCDRIAEKFFGAEGVKSLQEARQQTTRIKEYYKEGIERMELVTPDGQKLIGKGAIKNACNSAFEGNNLGLARACGNFAVKNGYATQEEIENGLKILETFSQKGQGVDFDNCRFNPESCREFLPDEFRSQFDSQFEIFRIMSESIGFDPARCENSYDSDISRRCLEGAKKALSQVEEIAKNSSEARRIVDEIRSHITEGERMTSKLDEFNQDLSRGGMTGPGGCRGPEECFKYCSQPGNSAECISFGAKSQIFEQNTVVQRFNAVNEQFNMPQNQPYSKYPYPSQDNNNFPNTNTFPIGQNQNQYSQYPYPYPPSQQPVGPSPECFAAISSGDFAKAKTTCSSATENYPRPIAEPFPVCPAYAMPSPCPEGQMRQQASDARGCLAYGACTVIENYKPIDTSPRCAASGTYWNGTNCVPYQEQDTNCPIMPTVTSCPAGQEKYETYSSKGCGVYYGCRTITTTTPCPASQYWNGLACTESPTPRCSSDQWWDPVIQSCKSSPIPTVGSCNYSAQYWKPSTSQCMPRTNCYETANSEYNSMECQGVRGSTTVSYGCGSLTTQATCQASPGCGWANGACGGSMTTSTGACPSGQYWYTPPSGGAGYCITNTSFMSGSCPAGYHPHGESGGFCMNDQENYSGTCYNSAGTSTITCPQQTYTAPTGGYGCGGYSTQTSCQTVNGCSWQNNACMPTSSTYNTCPSGQYWYTPPSGGAGYCMSSTTTGSTACPSDQYWNGSACVANSTTYTADPSAACAQGGGTWNTSSNYCQIPTCPSGQYWYTPPSGGAGYCMSSTTTGSTACPSDQYWNGSACVSSTTSTSTTDTASMSAACAQAGGTWSGSACQMPTTTATGGSASCASNQYWDGSACVSSTTSTSTSDTASMSAACAQAGGTWSGSACQMPTTTSSTTTSSTTSGGGGSDPATMCAQSGGTWSGSACQMPTTTSSARAYYSYYQKQSDGLVAQVVKAFADLFR